MIDALHIEANANVALVKYWGKADEAANRPATGSVSISLDALKTTTIMKQGAGPNDEIWLNGESVGTGVDRIQSFIDRVRTMYVGIGPVHVISTNSFPTGAGLASSASGFAALAIGINRLCDIGLEPSDVSRLARLGSGSAARSVYGGFVAISADGDGAAVPIDVDMTHWPLTVLIAVTDTAAKSVGSMQAMQRTAETSPYYAEWVQQHPADMIEAHRSIVEADFDGLATVSIRSCMKMHAAIMAARPPIIYWNSGTMAVVNAVEGWREAGRRDFYTNHAGPQVKVICHQDDVAACNRELAQLPGVRNVIESGIGGEPRVHWSYSR